MLKGGEGGEAVDVLSGEVGLVDESIVRAVQLDNRVAVDVGRE